jgi:hypothetical protein
LFFRGNRGDISNELLQAALAIAQGAISAILGGGNVASVVSPTFQAIQRAFQLFDSNRFEQALSGTSQLQVSATLPANQPVHVFTMFHSGISVKATTGSMASATIEMPQLQLLDVSVEFLGPPPPPGGQLVTLFINAWRLPDSPPNPDRVPLRIVIRRPEAACPQPMGQCPGDEVIPFYLLRLDGAMPFTRQLPANTAIQIEALPVVGRTFVRFDRKDEQGRVVSSDSVNPVMYSVLPCWGAQPCNAPNGPITVTAVYR